MKGRAFQVNGALFVVTENERRSVFVNRLGDQSDERRSDHVSYICDRGSVSPLHGLVVVVCRPTCTTNKQSTPQTEDSNGLIKPSSTVNQFPSLRDTIVDGNLARGFVDYHQLPKHI